MLTRRHTLAAGATLGLLAANRACAAGLYQPSGALIDAARKEGRMMLYTTGYTEVEQEVINVFNKTFPFVKVEMVRAPGGQMITRVQTEAAAGKLVADVVDHSDASQMAALTDLFMDYQPPNAVDYIPATVAAGKFWPTITPAWGIAYNSALVKTPPQHWRDLCDTDYGPGEIGMVIAASGGSTFGRIMFERMVLGEDFWAKQAATKPKLFPSGAPLGDAIVRGEVKMGAVLLNAVYAFRRDGAPVEMVFPVEGVPVVFNSAGIPKTAAHPNAARLYLDWKLSVAGQTDAIKERGMLTSLKDVPAEPKGFDAKVVKVWVPEFLKNAALREPWTAEWNQTYGYRQ
jgi:iron(III) transport system substrate-binding protein